MNEDFFSGGFGVSLFDEADTNAQSWISQNRPHLLSALENAAKGLDPFQTEVYHSDYTQQAKVIANAGSGKTHTVIYKAIKMVLENNVKPSTIVVISYTNKASKELRDRYLRFFEANLPMGCVETLDIPHMSTIHSLGMNVMYKTIGERMSVMSEGRVKRLIRNAYKEVMKVEKVDVIDINRIKYAFEHIAGNMECHLFGVPRLDILYQYHGMLPYSEMEKTDPALLRRHINFSGSSQTLRVMMGSDPSIKMADFEDKVFREGFLQSIREHYANLAQLSCDQLEKIWCKVNDEKYTIRSGDFSDMQLAPLYYFLQHPEALPTLWARFSHIFCDEAQDIDALNFALLLHCDKDSYTSLRYYNPSLYHDQISDPDKYKAEHMTLAPRPDDEDAVMMFRESLLGTLREQYRHAPLDLVDEENPFNA